MILIGVRFDATLAMQVRLASDQINTGQGAASKSWVETRTTVVVVFARGGLWGLRQASGE